MSLQQLHDHIIELQQWQSAGQYALQVNIALQHDGMGAPCSKLSDCLTACIHHAPTALYLFGIHAALQP